MPSRHILGRAKRRDEDVWFTLVVEDSATYFVEQYAETRFPLTLGNFQKIMPEEFNEYQIDDVSLQEVVEKKLREILQAA